MTQPQSEQVPSSMYIRTIAELQRELRHAQAQIAVYESEVERLIQVCSQQATEHTNR